MKKDGLGVKILLPKFTVSLQNEGRYYWILSKCSRKILNDRIPTFLFKTLRVEECNPNGGAKSNSKKTMQACFQIPSYSN